MPGFAVGSYSETFKGGCLSDTGGVLGRRRDILIHQSCIHRPPQGRGDAISALKDRQFGGERKGQVVLEERITQSSARCDLEVLPEV